MMGEWIESLWFVGVMVILGVLFAAGLRIPVPPAGAKRTLLRIATIAAAVAVAILANMAMYKHDAHLDVTQEKAFTPSPEAQQVIASLKQDVEIVYFYQGQSPSGRAAKTMVELMGRITPRLRVRTIDPDQNPAAANLLGVRLYNVALIRSGDDRLEVNTTDDREIALGIVRLLRKDARPVCFATGHGEYDIDNFEFHTHFEGSHSHNHDSGGLALVNMEQHGVGRFKRALERLGLRSEKVLLPTTRAVPGQCAVLIFANPRKQVGPPEVDALAAYLRQGGALLMLVEPDYAIEPRLAELLARAGLRFGDGVVSDPASHYYTDDQMIAISTYPRHPATVGLELSFYPGARPVEVVPAPGVRAMPVLTSSASSVIVPLKQRLTQAPRTQATAVYTLGALAEGKWDAGPAKPFRVAIVGDADFASNSFFPYLSNADVVLNLTAWLRGEERSTTLKPPVEVLPTVDLTNRQMQGIFIAVVLVLPGLIAALGALVWWMRRY